MKKDPYFPHVKNMCFNCKQPTMQKVGDEKVCSKCGLRVFISKPVTAEIGKTHPYFLEWRV